MAKEGFLDPIEDDGTAAEVPADQPADESGAEEGSKEPAQETRPEKGQEPAKKPDQRPEGYVTKEERDRIARERDEYRQRSQILEERTQKIIDRFFAEKPQQEQAQEPAEDEPPDENQDPLGALAWTKRQLQKLREQSAQEQRQTQQQSEAQRQWQEAHGAVNSYFIQAKAAKPELESLYNGVRESIAREYAAYAEATGQPVNIAQIQQMVERQEAQIIQWAYQNRVPIDALIERMAEARGVTARAAAQKQSGEGQRQTPERDPATGQFVASEAEKAARQRESQERNASLSAAPGSPVKKMTPKELASMPEEEMWRMFDNVTKKPGAKQFEREMGFRS